MVPAPIRSASIHPFALGNIDGNTGTDLLDYSNLTAVQVPAGVQVNLQLGTASLIGGAVQAIENVTGSQANDTLVGNAQNNSLNGFDGNDTITGAAGNDTITGGSGTDTLLESFTGIVTLTNTSFNGNGADTLSAIEAADFTGSVGNDQLTISFTGQVTGTMPQVVMTYSPVRTQMQRGISRPGR